jgi:hypothetical protein
MLKEEASSILPADELKQVVESHGISSPAKSMRLGVASGVLLTLICCIAGVVVERADAAISCHDRVAVDYGKPFERMPRAEPPPKSGVLPFAPRTLRLYQSAGSTVLPGGGLFGYAFSLESTPPRGLRLDWLVEMRIVEVDKHGRAVRVVQEQQKKFGVVHNERRLKFIARVMNNPGFYRYSLVFQRGRLRLRRYTTYFRILPPKFSAIFQTDSSSYQRGNSATLRISNLGTEEISYGEAIEVERFDGITWSAVNWPISRRGVRVVGVDAGERGPCEVLRIPADAVPGEYRVIKEISLFSSDVAKAVADEFQVKG